MKRTKINNFKFYDLVKNPNISNKLIYQDLLSIKYATVLVIGASRSGKTELIRNILYHVVIPWESKLFILAPTVFDDKSYGRLIKRMKGINEMVLSPDLEDSFFIKLKEERNKENSDLGAENIVLFDDISDVLKNAKQINYLATKNRHQKTFMIVSTQNYVDTNTKLRRQATHLILFGGLMEQDLELIYSNFIKSNFHIDLEKFYSLYRNETKEKYQYILIDTLKKKIRSGMTEELDI